MSTDLKKFEQEANKQSAVKSDAVKPGAVKDSADKRLAYGFEVRDLESLKSFQAQRVKAFISSVCPRAGLVGVHLARDNWDIRPVMALKNEQKPSVYRLLSNDINKSKEISALVKHTFETLQRSAKLNVDFREWGVYQGQIWYRRALVVKTLEHQLKLKEIRLEVATCLLFSLVEEITAWHQRGMIHGNLSSSNIYITPGGGVVLLDPAVGAGRVCANPKIKFANAAPELIKKQALSDRADSYGLGKIIEEIINNCKGAPSLSDALEKIKNKLLNNDPFKRPLVEDLLSEISALPQQEYVVVSNGRSKTLIDDTLELSRKEVREIKEDLDTNSSIPRSNSTPNNEFSNEAKNQDNAVQNKAAKPVSNTLVAGSVAVGSMAAAGATKSVNALKAKSTIKKEPAKNIPVKNTPIRRVKINDPEFVKTKSEPVIKDSVVKKPLIKKTLIKEQEAKKPLVEKTVVSEPKTTTPEVSKTQTNNLNTEDSIFDDFTKNFNSEIESDISDTNVFEVDDSNQVAKSNEIKQDIQNVLASSDNNITTSPADSNLLEKNLVTENLDAKFDIPSAPEEEELLPIDDILDDSYQDSHSAASNLDSSDIFDPVFDSGAKKETNSPFADWDDDTEYSNTTSSKLNKKSSNSFAIYLIIIGFLLLGIWYYFRVTNNYTSVDYSMRQLQADWDSKIPSRMLGVAELAVDNSIENKIIQDYIVSTAKSAEQFPNSVNKSLLRIAFNNRWEIELKPEDRRAAISIALASLLNGKLPNDLQSLEELHPGVLLAVTATAGDSARKILDKIPAITLTNLSQPFGAAFTKLLETNTELSCASDEVRLLAKIGSVPVDQIKPIDIKDFLYKDADLRLKALSVMVSYDDLIATKVLDVLINQKVIENEEVKWANTWDLINWGELSSADRLFILAGINPTSRLTVDRVKLLFTHPNPKIRAFAIETAKEKISFKHAGSKRVFDLLKQNPELLTGEQLLRLAEILQDPTQVTDDRVKTWLSTEPAVEIVAAMLIGSDSKIDTWFSYYLKQKAWLPDTSTIIKLTKHKDNYTRLYSYTALQNRIVNGDVKQADAKLILESALANETEADFITQLELMLEQFNN